MKKVLFFTAFVMIAFLTQAQQLQVPVNQGDSFTIKNPASSEFQHIHFPRKNFIIKRGGIADMKSVYGTEVVVTSVNLTNKGNTEVTLKRQDGRKFFRNFPEVTADLEQALQAGELTH